jgi:hypothetical protein
VVEEFGHFEKEGRSQNPATCDRLVCTQIYLDFAVLASSAVTNVLVAVAASMLNDASMHDATTIPSQIGIVTNHHEMSIYPANFKIKRIKKMQQHEPPPPNLL